MSCLMSLILQDNGNARMGGPFGPPMGWPGMHGIPTTSNVKRIVRLDVPVDKYPSVSNLTISSF